MKKGVFLIFFLVLILLNTACRTSPPESVSAEPAPAASSSAGEEHFTVEAPPIPEPGKDAEVYSQLFEGKNAALGNMLFIRQLEKHMGGDIEGLSQKNTLALEAGGKYRLVKAFSCEGKQAFNLSYVFQGSYEESGVNLTLFPPESVTAYVNWGTLGVYFAGQEGEFTQQDSLAYLRAFNTPFLGDDNGSGEMYIGLNKEEQSFEIKGNQNENERYTVQDLWTSRGDLKIYGNITLPAGYAGERLPVVIFAHGFSGNQAMQQDIAIMLAQNGIASYRFDFCGGALNGCKSDGSFYDMSMLSEKEDLHSVIDFIKEQDFCDKENIYLFGESMGGAVAALAAAERLGDIKGQLHFYPAFSISEQTRAAYETEEMIPERAPTSAGISVDRKFYADALKIDIYKEIAPYDGPVLMFHGDLDMVVPIVYVKNSLDVFKNAELVVYGGEGHGFTRQTKLKAVAKMLAFIQEHSKE